VTKRQSDRVSHTRGAPPKGVSSRPGAVLDQIAVLPDFPLSAAVDSKGKTAPSFRHYRVDQFGSIAAVFPAG
jgi:hypothetical protein